MFERRKMLKIAPFVNIFDVSFPFHINFGDIVERRLSQCVCGIAHCTWLCFDRKYEGKPIVGRPTNYLWHHVWPFRKYSTSSVICLLLRVFIVYALARMDEELNFNNVHNQIQPYLFEPLASGHDSSDNNSRELGSASQDGDYNVDQECLGQVDWWAFRIYWRTVGEKNC